MESCDDDQTADELAELSDEELEQELTIAASHSQREERYYALLAELSRRRDDPRD